MFLPTGTCARSNVTPASAERRSWPPCSRTRAPASLAAALVALTACHPDPAYALPDVETPAVAVRIVDAIPGTTVDLGTDATEFCVLRSVQGPLEDPSPAPVEAGTDVGAVGLPDVNLYVDRSSGTWHLAAYGAVTATVGCVPWRAFGAPRSVTQIDNGSAAALGDDAAPSIATTGGSVDCVLSDIEGDFGSPGNGARLDGGALIVTHASGNSLYASATCLGTEVAGDASTDAIPFIDYPVDASGGTMRVAVMRDADGLCGIGSLSGMNAADSSLAISDGAALGAHAVATVRCFAYGTPDAH